MRRRSAMTAIIAGLVLSVGLSVPAAAATAQSKDEDFALLLGMKDYYYGTDRDSISLARDICSRLKKAQSPKAKVRTAKTIGTALKLSGWSFDKGNQFVSTAVVVYCPSQSSYVIEGFSAGY